MTWKRSASGPHCDEGHHKLYGKPWAIGLDHYQLLVDEGLQPQHDFLDLGCGAGRTGIHVIDYLEEEKYTGVDGHLPSIDAFRNYEVPLNRLSNKKPRITYQDIRKKWKFGAASYDYVFAWSVLNHISGDTLAVTKKVYSALKPGGKFVSGVYCLTPEEMSIGFSLVREGRLTSQFVDDKPGFAVYEKPRSFR